MGSLNEIPGHSGTPEDDDAWTPGRGVTWGACCTLPVALLLGTLLGLLARYVPPVTTHWLVSFTWGLVICWVLFAAMHKASGMAGVPCTLVVIAYMILIFAAKYVALLAHFAASMDPPGSAWSLFDFSAMLYTNWCGWTGVVAAVWMCHDGDSGFEALSDMLMTNPFTGRRT